jgi:hypothetical protein
VLESPPRRGVGNFDRFALLVVVSSACGTIITIVVRLILRHFRKRGDDRAAS